MQATFPAPAASSFSTLFARYVNGQITDKAFNKIMKTFDAIGISQNERIAFARFMNDMIVDGRDKLNVPQPEEARDILTDMRGSTH